MLGDLRLGPSDSCAYHILEDPLQWRVGEVIVELSVGSGSGGGRSVLVPKFAKRDTTGMLKFACKKGFPGCTGHHLKMLWFEYLGEKV